MTSFGHLLVVVCVSLLCCSFAATGEVIPKVKLPKLTSGDCGINRQLTNTERMTNDAADFWNNA